MLRYVFLIVALNLFQYIANAQNAKVDSLLTLLKKDKEDTNKINHLNALGWELMNSNPDTAIVLSNQAIEIIISLFNVPGEELEEELKTNQSAFAKNLKRLYANSFGNLGVCYRLKGNYPQALAYFQKALTFAEELKDKSGTAKYLGNIGVCCRLKGDYPKALDYFLKSLKMDEELGNKTGIATRLGNIGSVYWNQGDYTKALDNYLKALKINEGIGDKKGIATNLGNMGSVYYQQGDYSKALENYLKALEISEQAGYKQLQSTNLGNIGAVYKDKKDYPKALEYCLKALKMAEDLGDKNSIAIQLGSIGSLYAESPSLPATGGETKKGFALAADYTYRALAISDSIGAMDNVKSWYQQLSMLYEKSNVPLTDTVGGILLNMEQMRLRALYYNKRYMAVRDTLFSVEKKKLLISKEMDFAFEKQQAAEKAEQEKQLALAEADQNQHLIIWILFACVLVLAGFVFRLRRTARKQKGYLNKNR